MNQIKNKLKKLEREATSYVNSRHRDPNADRKLKRIIKEFSRTLQEIVDEIEKLDR